MSALILITTPTQKEANSLTQLLLKRKLAACVNLVPVATHYWWKGKIEDAEETLMLVKTQSALSKEVVKLVTKYHSYEIPEIIALPITQGNPKYLQWIVKSVKPGRKNIG